MEEAVFEKSVFEEVPTRKIYSERAISVATFMGGPLVAGYLMAENFKVFGDAQKVKKAWIISILSTIFAFALIFLIPENINIPNVIFPLIYMSITSYLVKIHQEQKIKEHLHQGGEKYNWWRTIAISIIGCIITVGPVVAIGLATEAANGRLTESTKNYGTMGHEIMYQNNINENEVDRIADALTKEAFFDDTFKKYVYLEKIDDNYEISISCTESIKFDLAASESFVQLRNEMQKSFPNNRIILKLVVDNLDNVAKRIE